MTIDPKEFLQNILVTKHASEASGRAEDENDDSTRLVYADYLEENGDLARAELIRAQCTIGSHAPWERATVEAKVRAEAALAEHGKRFRAELPAIDGVEWTDFERGFPSTVKVNDVKALYAHADEIAAAAPVHRAHVVTLDETADPYIEGSIPWLRTLRVASGDSIHVHATSSILGAVETIEIPDVEEYQICDWLFTNPQLPKLREVVVEGRHVLGQQFIDGLTSVPWSEQLRTLRFGTRFVDYDSGYFEGPTLGAEGGATLEHFANVEKLDVSRQRIRDEGLAAVWKLPKLRELDARGAEATTIAPLVESQGTPFVRLDLSLNKLGDAGARALADAPRTHAVESLHLDTCEIGAAGVRALVGAPLWSTLRELDLSRNPLGEAGIRALHDAPAPARLHTLKLADVDLDAAAAALLAEIPWLDQLLVLDLSSNAITDLSGFASLATGSLQDLSLVKIGATDISPLEPVFARLVRLDLSGTRIHDGGVDALVRSGLAELQILKLDNCEITGRGFRTLATAAIPKLRSLDVSHNKLFPQSLAVLLRESSIANQLVHLAMSYTEQAPELADELATTTAFPRLRTLELRGVAFTEAKMLVLAHGPALKSIDDVKLTVDIWRFDPKVRDELFERFGRGYWYYDDSGDDESPY